MKLYGEKRATEEARLAVAALEDIVALWEYSEAKHWRVAVQMAMVPVEVDGSQEEERHAIFQGTLLLMQSSDELSREYLGRLCRFSQSLMEQMQTTRP